MNNLMIDIELTGWNMLWIVGSIFLFMVLFFCFYKKKQKSPFYFKSIAAELSASPKLKFTLERNNATLYLANRIWIELKTRKIALLFEEEHDNLMEVYDSWYELFQNLRKEIKTIPGQLVQKHSQWHDLISLTVEVMNEGLRPHLTFYHSRFEAWYVYEKGKPERLGQAPQDIQIDFPDYEKLIQHLKKSNQLLAKFTDDLEQYILEE